MVNYILLYTDTFFFSDWQGDIQILVRYKRNQTFRIIIPFVLV